MKRSRGIYCALVLVTIALGLTSRQYRLSLPSFAAAYAGDTLWAAMVYFIAATIWKRASPRNLAVGAILFSTTIEMSQLYHAPWIDAVRGTRLGGLVLGYGFLWSDLLCYLVGVCLAMSIDVLLQKKKRG